MRGKLRGGGLDGVEEGLLQEQILDGVGREGEFRKHRHRRPGLVAGLRQSEDGLTVAGRVARMTAPRAGGDAGEAVAVEGQEAGFGIGGRRHFTGPRSGGCPQV